MDTPSALLVAFAITAICFSAGLIVTRTWSTLWVLVLLIPVALLVTALVLSGRRDEQAPEATGLNAPATAPKSTPPPPSAVNDPSSSSSSASHPIDQKATTPNLLPSADDVQTTEEAFNRIAFAVHLAFHHVKEYVPGQTGYTVNRSKVNTPEYNLLKALAGVDTLEAMISLFSNKTYFDDTLLHLYQSKEPQILNGVLFENYTTPLEYFKALHNAKGGSPANIYTRNLYDADGNPLF
jgi:hypothetical protein